MAVDGLTLFGVQALKNTVAELAQFGVNSRSSLALVGAKMKEQVAETFALARDPVTGNPWKRTSDMTLRLRPGGGGGGKTLQDTGRLLQAIVAARPVVTDDSVSVGPGAKIVYAAIHNFGGVITPKNAKMLSLPLTREAKRFTGARAWWQANLSKSPFIYDPSKGAKAYAKRLYIATSTGKGEAARVKVHWMLVPRIAMPQRRFLGWGEAQIAGCLDVLAGLLDRTMEKLNGGTMGVANGGS